MRTRMASVFASLAMLGGCSASGSSSPTFNPAAGGGAGTAGGGGAVGGSGGSAGSAGFGGALIDGGGGKQGCNAVDILFVIDNSSSMCTYEKGLVQAFPFFVDAVNDALPDGIDLHVGITTSSFCSGGSHSETNCVAQESAATIQSVFKRPMDGMQPGNGFQGRLLEQGGKSFVAAKTGDPQSVQAMKDWFGQAAISVGCTGCAFDFTVGAAGYAAHPANDPTNAGFFRDEGAVLLLFVLTDEADHSTESLASYHDMITARKTKCGGDNCIITGALLSKFCAQKPNVQIWEFLNMFGEAPVWGDITGGSNNPLFQPPDPKEYTKVIADALAPVVKQTCDKIPPPIR